MRGVAPWCAVAHMWCARGRAMVRRARSTCLAFCTITPKLIMSGLLQIGSCTSSVTSANQAGLVVAAHTCVRGAARARVRGGVRVRRSV
jgi:hypothetical protein